MGITHVSFSLGCDVSVVCSDELSVVCLGGVVSVWRVLLGWVGWVGCVLWVEECWIGCGGLAERVWRFGGVSRLTSLSLCGGAGVVVCVGSSSSSAGAGEGCFATVSSLSSRCGSAGGEGGGGGE